MRDIISTGDIYSRCICFWEIEMVMINCEKQIGLLLHSYPIL